MADNAERALRAVPDLEEVDEPSDLALSFHDVVSDDGTRLRAWTNGVDGPTVLLCNGLGTSAYAWPALLRADCGVRVLSWNHRGVGGSERPADPARVGMDAFVEDALAVLDHAGVESAVVAGWSIGVNTAFELAVLHPHRVRGLFAVAGVPGGTFASMGAPLMLPRLLRRPLALGLTSLLHRTGGLLTPVTTRLPVGRRAAQALTHTGFMLPTPDLEPVGRTVREFLTTPVDWYMHLARVAAQHPRVPLGEITVPTAFVAGHFDLLSSAQDMRTAAARIPEATYAVLRGSHFLQLEHPECVHEELLALVARAHPDGAPVSEREPG